MTNPPTLDSLRGVFDQYYRPLCFFARRYLTSEADVQDVVMDVFLRLMGRERDFPSPLALRAFLYTAVHNAALNLLRRAARRNRSVVEADASGEDDYELDRIEDDVLFRMLQAVEELPAQCRLIFKASYFEGHSVDEVAQMFKLAPNTVRAQRQRARQLLRARLKEIYPTFVMLFML